MLEYVRTCLQHTGSLSAYSELTICLIVGAEALIQQHVTSVGAGSGIPKSNLIYYLISLSTDAHFALSMASKRP